jgi:glycosyltransferase involved in cell wall biosynthesis
LSTSAELASAAQRDVSTARVAWIASAYGFGDDLAYYRQIFAEFIRRFPRTVIHVHRSYPVDHYPELPMRADFTFLVSERHRTIGNGVPYAGRLRLPTPGTVWRIFRERADVVIIIEFTPTALVGWLSARLRRKRILLLVECDPVFRGAVPKPVVTAVKRRIALASNAVLTSNQHGHRYLREVLRLPEAHITVGPYLTSDPGLPELGAQPTSDRVRFLFLNTISQRKGITQLIEALASVPEGLRDQWTLAVVGSGDQDELVRSLVAERGLTGNVTFHGRVPHSETPGFYAGADIVVCPTLGDYRSLAGIEAVNSGKGVIVSTKDGASEEILRYAAAAWEVDPLDGPAFTKTLTDLLSDRAALSARLSAAQTPPPEFSVETVGDSYQRAMERALA